MIEILPQSSETNIGFKVSGKVTLEDYDVLLPKLDEAISVHGKINLLVMIDDLEGWKGMDAAKADFKFGTHEYRQVERAAFVGDKKWQEWMVKIMDPFTRRTDERYFEVDQLDDAWQWIKEDRNV
jgi:hypothetical protein